MMPDEELDKLAEDIKAHGLRKPVLMHMDPQTKRLPASSTAAIVSKRSRGQD